jgi:hypothetical protein
MRQGFEHRFKPTETKRKDILENGIVSVDANVLLDFYRVSESTRNELFSVFEKCKDRLWLAPQVVEEFYRNRVSVISTQIDCCRKFVEDLKSKGVEISNSINVRRAYPHLTDEQSKGISESIEMAVQQTEKGEEFLKSLLSTDEILPRIESLFHQKVGSKPSDDAIKELRKKVSERYELKTPPGYADAAEKLKSGRDPHGDGVLWFQLMDHVKSTGKDAVLVTNDDKEDWWIRIQGMSLDFRFEMREEFFSYTGKMIEIYLSAQFLRLVEKGSAPNAMAIKELEGPKEDSFKEVRQNEAVGRWLEMDPMNTINTIRLLNREHRRTQYKELCDFLSFAISLNTMLDEFSYPDLLFNDDPEVFSRIQAIKTSMVVLANSTDEMKESDSRRVKSRMHELLAFVLDNRLKF